MESDQDEELVATQAALSALKPLDSDQRARVIRWLSEKLEVTTVPQNSRSSAVDRIEEVDTVSQKSMSPKQFLAQKKPTKDVDRIACLAYYLTYMRDTPHFKTGELTALNTEAAARKFANISNAATNATRQSGYLAAAGKGQKQITALGEAVVEALPNYDKVAIALAEQPKRKNKSGKRKKVSENK